MELYSYKNQEPSVLPERIRLDSGETVTSLHELSTEELENLGFSGPFIKPEVDLNIQRVEWSGSEYVIVDLTENEIKQIKQNNVRYDYFVSKLKESGLILRLKQESKSSIELTELYYEFIMSLDNLFNSKNFNGPQRYINLIYFILSPTQEELDEISEIIVESKIGDFIKIPDKEYTSKYFYNQKTKKIEHKKGPFESWTLVDGKWKAPAPYPTDGKVYNWNESIKNWVEI
jgi:hypothetical protein